MKAVFRKHDYVIKERDAINDMIDGLRERLGGIKKESIAANAAFDRVTQSIEGLPDEMRREIEQLRIHLYGLSERLALFQLPSDTAGAGSQPAGACAAAKGEELGVTA